MATPMRPFRVPPFPAPARRAHHASRLDHQLARAAVGWSIWSDVDVDEVAERLLTLAAGNRTALERALRRFRQADMSGAPEIGLEDADTAAGRAAAALRLALIRGAWDR